MLNMRFVAAVLFVVIAFFVCAGGSLLAKNIESSLLTAVMQIAFAETDGQIETAVHALLQLWKEKHDILTLFLDHDQCDRIGESIAKIEFYGISGDAESLSLVCFQLSNMLEEMIAQEKISIYNLL